MRIVYLLVISAFLVSVFVLGAQYPTEASILPFIIAGALSTFVIAQLVREFINRKIEVGTTMPFKEVFRPYLQPFLWILGILPTIYLLGFVVGIPLYIFLYLKLHKESWRLSIIITIISALVVYFGFGELLHFRFHKGLLFPFI
jgi:hypothetical protein